MSQQPRASDFPAALPPRRSDGGGSDPAAASRADGPGSGERNALRALLGPTLEALPDGVVVTDEAGDVLLANRRFAALWRLPNEMLARLDGPELAEWALRQVLDAPRLRRRIEALRQPPGAECRDSFALADGRILERHAAPRLADGRRTGMVVSWRDVTDRAEAAGRTGRARSDFVARMSHELRTPLNAILGFSEVLRLDAERPLAEVQRQRVERIDTAGRHLLAMVDELLDIAGLEAGRLEVSMQPVDPAAELQAVLAACAPLAAAGGIALRLQDVADGIGPASADPARLRQVLLALVTGAIRHGRPGGSVSLGLGAVADHVTLTVADDGTGMNAAQLERLFLAFDRFDPAAAAAGRSGTGLFVARRLVELMHGALDVRSSPGLGSVFTVRLPRAQVVPTAGDGTAPAGERAAARAEHRPRVLYIEDDEVNRLLMQAYLGLRPDIALETADDGATGIGAALAGPPDLLLIDMMLPDIGGLEVLAALKAETALCGIPCVAVSANALSEQIAAALAAGFDDYLTKPLSAAALLPTVDRWLETGQRRTRAGGTDGPPTMTAPEERCDGARRAVANGLRGAARLGADVATALARPDPRSRCEPPAPTAAGRAERRPACSLHESSFS